MEGVRPVECKKKSDGAPCGKHGEGHRQGRRPGEDPFLRKSQVQHPRKGEVEGHLLDGRRVGKGGKKDEQADQHGDGLLQAPGPIGCRREEGSSVCSTGFLCRAVSRCSGLRLVLGYDVPELFPDGLAVSLARDRKKSFDLRQQRRRITGFAAKYHDFLVVRGDDALAGGDQLLVQFFPGPQAGKFDGDVLFRFQAVEPDEIPGHVDDPDRLAHVEDEDLAAFPHGSRLEDQLSRLGNAHEVAHYIGMGHRHGPPLSDLRLEDGNGRAGAAEDVPEADGHESRILPAVHALDEKLCDAFGGPHDVGGPHGLVRRDEYETLHLHFQRQIDEVARPQDVVQHRLPGVVLLHRHVLVGRGVKDDVGFEALQDPLQGIAVADVREEALRGQRSEPQLEFLLDLEQVELAEVEKPHDLRLETADLPDELGADGAPRPRDQNPLAAEKAADPLRVEPDFLPSLRDPPALPPGWYSRRCALRSARRSWGWCDTACPSGRRSRRSASSRHPAPRGWR